MAVLPYAVLLYQTLSSALSASDGCTQRHASTTACEIKSDVLSDLIHSVDLLQRGAVKRLLNDSSGRAASAGRHNPRHNRTSVPPIIALSAAVQRRTGSNGTAGLSVRAPPDQDDYAVLFPIMVTAFLLYCAVVACKYADPDDDGKAPETNFAPKFKAEKAWAISKLGILNNTLPAISTKWVMQSAEFPLMVPTKPLHQRGLVHMKAWSVDVLTSSGKPLLVANLRLPEDTTPSLFSKKEAAAQSRRMPAIEILGHGDKHGDPDMLIAKIDANLTLYNAYGEYFGKLVSAKKGEYALQEAGGRSQWVITPHHEKQHCDTNSFTITWRPPKGGSGRILATVRPDLYNSVDCVKIQNTDSVDGVLVMLCALGLISFVYNRKPILSSVKDDVQGLITKEKEEITGFASALLDRLQI